MKFETGGEDDLLKRLATRLSKSREEIFTMIRNSQSPELKFFRI